jgi:branched-chain amino acid transport system substrate-binding protein
LEDATKGTREVDKIVILAKDATRGNSDLAKSALAEAYEDEGADIAVGTHSSARQLRCCPWPGHKKMLIVEGQPGRSS